MSSGNRHFGRLAGRRHRPSIALLPRLRAARDILAHIVNRRLVAHVGPSSRLVGRIEVRAPGAVIEVGERSRIECRLLTGLATSRIVIGRNVFVGRRTVVESFDAVTIGDDVMISFECIISDSSGHSLDHRQRRQDVENWRSRGQWRLPGSITDPIHIGSDVWIGARVIILRGVSIGQGAVVGAGAVVTRDVPAWTVVAGNPARSIRELPNPDATFEQGATS